jgi:hypothetical protein
VLPRNDEVERWRSTADAADDRTENEEDSPEEEEDEDGVEVAEWDDLALVEEWEADLTGGG